MEFRTKRSLGQHFLRSERALSSIALAAKLSPEDLVLEIGPGEGVLTERLLATGATVIAVEKDDRLIIPLSTRFKSEAGQGQFLLLHGDILEERVRKDLSLILCDRPFKLVANIPYYITGILLRTFLDQTPRPSMMVLLVQKEVADEIIARDGKEGILSIAVKTYGTPNIVEKVPRGAFVPPPKVDSSILSIEHIRDPFPSEAAREHFFSVLRTGFRSKRKMLVNTLARRSVERTSIAELLGRLGIPLKARPENLSPKDWERIAFQSPLRERSVESDR